MKTKTALLSTAGSAYCTAQFCSKTFPAIFSHREIDESDFLTSHSRAGAKWMTRRGDTTCTDMMPQLHEYFQKE